MRPLNHRVRWIRKNYTIMFGFEKLDIWEKSVDFTDVVYSCTRVSAADECFGLMQSIRLAAVSVSTFIADGSSTGSRSSLVRRIEMASDSLQDVIVHSHLATSRGFLTAEALRSICIAAAHQNRLLGHLRRSLPGDV